MLIGRRVTDILITIVREVHLDPRETVVCTKLTHGRHVLLLTPSAVPAPPEAKYNTIGAWQGGWMPL